MTVIVKCKGNYEGSEISFAGCYAIKKKPEGAVDLSQVKITMKDNVKKSIPSQSYTGKAITPDFDVYARDGKNWVKAENKGLVKGTDYEVTYMNNTAKGTATILVKAKSGSAKAIKSKTATFKIVQRSFSELMQLFR